MAARVENLADLLEQISESAKDRDKVPLGEIIQAIGNRSFGPLLLLVGIVLTSPLSGIPGIPTTMGVLVLLIAGQLILRRQRFWLPRWLLNRQIACRQIDRLLRWGRRPAAWVDRLLRPRWSVLVNKGTQYIIALIGAVLALGMPLMELVPFSASAAGVALGMFGLALIANDGVLALIAFTLTGSTILFIITKLT